ncbi:MAG: hypothetical protein KBD01_17950 [Acidobacteria bacterium]|nr:hypothetical protein [Acidobacteriota bacterium]
MNQHSGLVRTAALIALLVGLLALAGCAARSAFDQGERAVERELWDSAVLSYAKAVALDPTNSRYKVALQRAKLRAAADHFERGKKYMASSQLELAIQELQQTVLLDPSHSYAKNELQKALTELERRQRGPSQMDLAESEAGRRARELGPPRLDPTSNIPLVLRMPETTVGDVYETLSKSSGINFLYDDKLDLKKKTSVELANVTFEKAMDILMLTNKHFYKVIDAHTILIAEDNRQKRQEWEDHVIRTFYLSNAETKDVQTLLRGLLETRRLAENQDLNAITIKDTPEKVKVAERIIKANDKAKGEVIVDIELLEINRTRLQRLGMDLSAKTLSLTFGDGKQSVPLNNLERLRSQSAWTLGPIPSVVINFLKSDSDSQTLARPQLRILEGENGKVTIGDRVPIPATSFNTSQTIGGNIVPITSFTYQNVGIIVDVKPRVHHNKEITLELKLEVSSISGFVEGSGGISQPTIGTRSVETTIRLNDGETNLLAGLIKDDERTSLAGIPGLSHIPYLKRIFGTTETNDSNTDIVLSLTPHIIRVPNIEPIDLVPLWVGTEDQVRLRGVARNALGESPFSGEEPWDEINRELNGGEATGAAEKTPQVKVTQEGGAARAEGQGAAKATPQPGRGGRAATPGAGKGRTPAPPVPTPPAQPPGGADAQAGPEVEDVPGDTFQEEEDLQDEDLGEDEEEEAPPEEPRRTSVSQIRLAPDPPSVSAGSGVGVDLLISGAEGVSTVNFQLRYNKDVLRFSPPAELGDFMSQGGAPADIQAVESAEGGLVVVSLTRGGQAGASGSGRLVRLNFVALAPGSAGFGFSAAQVRGPDSQALPASFRISNLEVSP